MKVLAAAFSLLVWLSAPAAGAQTPDGKALFHAHCAGCHGENAVGQDPEQPNGGWREDGSRIAPALDGSAHAWHHEPELLYQYVQSGSVDPESPMPSFGGVLDDAQIRAVIRYFQSLWPERIRESYGQRFPGGLD